MPHWLAAWYGAFAYSFSADCHHLRRRDRPQIALVPLIHRVQGRIRIVEFADLDLTDYNAPILGLRAEDAMDARALCQALVAALRRLPEGVDLVRLRKMPAYDRRQAKSAGRRWDARVPAR